MDDDADLGVRPFGLRRRRQNEFCALSAGFGSLHVLTLQALLDTLWRRSFYRMTTRVGGVSRTTSMLTAVTVALVASVVGSVKSQMK